MSRFQGATVTKLLDPVSAANTAAATSAWTDVRAASEDVTICVQVGALTGTITWTIEHASDSGGTGGAGITPLEGAFAAGAANQAQRRTVNIASTQGFIRVVGTIGTGPALVASHMHIQPKYI